MNATEEIALIRAEIEQAAEALITLAERGLKLTREARAGSPTALDEIGASFLAVLETCAFQDLTGQRLSRLAAAGGLSVQLSQDPLLAGPANPGAGLDQAAANRLLSP